jgi:hypothetical protein
MNGFLTCLVQIIEFFSCSYNSFARVRMMVFAVASLSAIVPRQDSGDFPPPSLAMQMPAVLASGSNGATTSPGLLAFCDMTMNIDELRCRGYVTKSSTDQP